MLLTAFLFLISLFLTLICIYKFSKTRPENFPPGPPRLPLWGSYWFMLKENYKHAHLSLEYFAKYYNTDILGLYLGDTPCVVTFSDELCREMLTRDEFIGRNDTIITRSRGLGEMRGIFFVDGLLWKYERRFTLRCLRDHGFGRRSVDLENFVQVEVRHLIDLFKSEPSKDDTDIIRKCGEVLIPDVFYGFLLNNILLILTSTRFDNLKLRKIARAGLRFQRSGDATGAAISMTPWLRYIAPNFFGFTSAVESNNYLLEFLKEVLDQHIETFSDDHHRDFIDDYLSKKTEDNEFDYEQLWLTMLDFMVPAAIAIGHTLSFYFAHLINYPDVQVKIQKEIENVVGQSRLPNLDDRKFMPYTEASIRENIRILPINPLGVARRCMEDTILAGYFIPKDTIMLPCIWTAHKDERVWKDPANFSPERFLDTDGQLLKKDRTMGFGAGKRLCAGETFARQTMFLIVTGLLQNFSFESPSGKPVELEDLVPGANLSLKENWVKAVPR